MLDDDRWKAVTTVGYLAHPETLKHRPCRSHAVNVTMPIHGHPVVADAHCATLVSDWEKPSGESRMKLLLACATVLDTRIIASG